MYHTWFFQKRLASALDDKLRGLKLLQCFSQQKDELVLSFADEEHEIHIKTDFGNSSGIISIQSGFARARKNSVDLFNEVIRQEVTECSDFLHDRSFRILFSNNQQLIFKMHGSRGNILLAQDDRVLSVFRKKLNKDVDLVPSELHNHGDLNSELVERLMGRYRSIQDAELLESQDLSICSNENGPQLYFGTRKGCFSTQDPIEATNKYAEIFYKVSVFEKERDQLFNVFE